MVHDDFFESIPPIDVFPFEVDTLVISLYKASIAKIEDLDKEAQIKFRSCDLVSDPQAEQERWWWDDEVQNMKFHAGNMGLVSLFSLFDHWLERHEQGNGWRSRFNRLEEHLGEGPLSLRELEEIATARNSIVHHRGRKEYTYKGQHKVTDSIPSFQRCFWRGASSG